MTETADEVAEPPALGTRTDGGLPKISIKFEEQLFAQINAYAAQVDCSFAEAVRLLVTYAFDQLAQEEQQAKEQESAKWQS